VLIRLAIPHSTACFGRVEPGGFLKVSRWSPRRTRFYHEAPKMAEIVRRVDAERLSG